MRTQEFDVETKEDGSVGPHTPPRKGSSSSEGSSTGSSDSPLLDGESSLTKEGPLPDAVELTTRMTETVDLAACPEFNGYHRHLKPGQGVVIRDTDGVIALVLHELAKAGLLSFTAESWTQLLSAIHFENFESGVANTQMKEFDTRRKNYQKMRTHEAPWDTPDFHEAQRCLNQRIAQFETLLDTAAKAAAELREQYNIPTREIIFIGDTTCDEDASAGDRYLFCIPSIAQKYGFVYTEMASNHGFFSIGLHQSLAKRFSPRDMREENGSWLTRLLVKLTQAKHPAKQLSPTLKEALYQLLVASFPKSLEDTLNPSILRNISGLFKQFTSPEKEMPAVFAYQAAYAQYEAIEKDRRVPFEARQASLEQKKGEMKSVLRQFFDAVQADDAALLKKVLKAVPALKPAFLPSHALDRDQLLEEFKRQSATFDTDTVLSVFQFLKSIPATLFEDIRACQQAIQRMNDEIKTADSDDVKKNLRKAKKTQETKAHALKILLAELLSILPVKEPVLLKIMTIHCETQKTPKIEALIRLYLPEVSSPKRNGPFSHEDLNRVHRAIAGARNHERFPEDPTLLTELVCMPNGSTVFQDMTNMLEDLMTVSETILRQPMALPNQDDFYRGSTYSLWRTLLPRYNLGDIHLDWDQERITVDGQSVYRIYGARIRLRDDVVQEWKNYTRNRETGERSQLKDTDDFRARVNREFKQACEALDCQILDKNGEPTTHMQRRQAELNSLYVTWVDSQCLVRRSGLSGDYIRHAPAVGVFGETTDESMIRHSLVPIAKIMLQALWKNTQGTPAPLKQEATTRYQALKQSLKRIPESLLNNPHTHQTILAFIAELNGSFRFFLRHHLVIPEMTPEIPDTHVGLFSRSHEADRWEAILQQSGRYAEGLPPDFGLLTEGNPLYALVYPLAGLVWSRTDNTRPESMIYKEAKTNAILCSLQHTPDVIYGHTGGPGIHGKGIDRPKDEKRQVRQETTTAIIDVTPDLALLQHLPVDIRYNPDLFLPLLVKQCIEAANDEEINRRRSETATELQEIQVVPNSKQAPDIQKMPQAIPSLRQRYEECAQKIAQIIEGDQTRSVTHCLAELLNQIETHPHAPQELKAQASIAKKYLPTEIKARKRAEHAYSVKKGFQQVTHNGGLLKHVQLANFWLVFFALDPNTASLLRREVALRYVDPRGYREDIANYASAHHFHDNLLRALCEAAMSDPQNPQAREVQTTGIQEVFGGLAVIPATCAALAQFSYICGPFLTDYADIKIEHFLGNYITLLISTSFFWSIFILLKFKDQLLTPKQTPFGRKPPSPALVHFLSGLKRLFPQFSGLSHQSLFSFFVRPFLYLKLVTMINELYTLSADGFVCPSTNQTNTTTAASSTTTTATALTTTTTIGFATYFGYAPLEAFYPYYGTAVLWGLVVSTFGLVLSLKDPTTKIFPGHDAPSRELDKFERSLRVRMQMAHKLWEGYNTWFDGNLFMGVGLYLLLYLCTRSMEAFVASSSMVFLFTLRLIAYPPKWISSCLENTKMRLDTCRPTFCARQKILVADGALTVTDRKGNCAELDKKKMIQIISLIVNNASTLPINFYFLYGFYFCFVNSNLSVQSFVPFDLTDQVSQGLWASVLPFLGILSIDTGLSVARDFTAVSDLDKAKKARVVAQKSVKKRESSQQRIANCKKIKASVAVDGEQDDLPVSITQETDIGSKFKSFPQRNKSDSIVDNYKPKKPY